MKYLLFFIFSVLSQPFFAQENYNLEQSTKAYINFLYEKGIEKNNGSLKISEDSKKAISDSTYRKMLYPKEYTWDKVNFLIQKKYLKQAFWHLINLYEINQESKEMAVRIVIAYNQIFDMELALIGAFHSYSFMDQEIGGIINGKLSIKQPNILEDKLRNLNELVKYLNGV